MACEYSLGEKDVCGTTIEVGSLSSATEYTYHITDTALQITYTYTETTDGSGNAEITFGNLPRVVGRTYEIKAFSSLGVQQSFTQGSATYDTLCFEFIEINAGS